MREIVPLEFTTELESLPLTEFKSGTLFMLTAFKSGDLKTVLRCVAQMPYIYCAKYFELIMYLRKMHEKTIMSIKSFRIE